MPALVRLSSDDVAYAFPAGRALLFADDPQRRATLAAGIARAGGRVVASAELAEARDRLTGGGATVVVLDIGTGGDDADGDADGGRLDALLDRLGGGVGEGRLPALVLIPIALIDRVAARLAGPGIDILVDATPAEEEAALATLLAPRAARVAEDGEAENRRRLGQLSDEVGRIARALAALSAERLVVTGETPSIAARAALLRSLLRLRRLRGLHFEPALFADPAWDILPISRSPGSRGAPSRCRACASPPPSPPPPRCAGSRR